MHVAFVAGATGYTGREVVLACRRLGWRTVAHIRPGSAALARWQPRFAAAGAEVDTTPWELDAMTGTLARVRPSVVFALLGTTRQRARGEGLEARDAYRRVDYGLTALLVDAALASGSRPRFVYLSSVGAGSAGGNAYLQARADVEAKLRGSGLPWTIVRPSFITGPDREESRPLERVTARLADSALAVAATLGARSLRDRYRSTDAATLAAALAAAASDPACENVVLESAEARSLGRRPGSPIPRG